jgi:hypothetical protein
VGEVGGEGVDSVANIRLKFILSNIFIKELSISIVQINSPALCSPPPFLPSSLTPFLLLLSDSLLYRFERFDLLFRRRNDLHVAFDYQLPPQLAQVSEGFKQAFKIEEL